MVNLKYVAYGAIIAGSFLIGRFSAPEKIKTENKSISLKAEDVASDKTSNKESIVTEIKRKDGSEFKRTVIRDKVESKKDSIKSAETMTSEKKEITTRSGVVVSLLVGTPLSLAPSLAYGVSVQKQVLGPINLGAWGLQVSEKPIAGLSIGLGF